MSEAFASNLHLHIHFNSLSCIGNTAPSVHWNCSCCIHVWRSILYDRYRKNNYVHFSDWFSLPARDICKSSPTLWSPSTWHDLPCELHSMPLCANILFAGKSHIYFLHSGNAWYLSLPFFALGWNCRLLYVLSVLM